LLDEGLVRVSADPQVALFVAQTAGPADRVLLVIHGGPDWDHSYLREPLAGLAGSCRVVFADLRGCGRSTRGLGTAQYTPDAVVADLLALLSALDVAQADVLGFSYGGELGQRLTLAAPDRVRSLIIASSSVQLVPADAYDDWPEVAGARVASSALWMAGDQEPTPQLVRAAAVARIALDVWRPQARAGYRRRLEDVRFSADWARVFAAGLLSPARPGNSLERLAALGIPVLLLHGRQDMTYPAALAEQAAARLPRARVAILDEAGHMAHVDDPEAWLAAVARFLSRQLPASAP
jgi:pimeloyl-ACP methyl ester carboxylesterase